MRIRGYAAASDYNKVVVELDKALEGAKESLRHFKETSQYIRSPEFQDKDSDVDSRYDRLVSSFAAYIGALTVEREYIADEASLQEKDNEEEETDGEGL